MTNVEHFNIDPKKFINVDPKKGITDHLKDAYEDLLWLARILNYCGEHGINPYAENPDRSQSSSTMFIEFLPDVNLANISWRQGDMTTDDFTTPSWLMGNIEEALESIITLYLEHDKQATINL